MSFVSIVPAYWTCRDISISYLNQYLGVILQQSHSGEKHFFFFCQVVCLKSQLTATLRPLLQIYYHKLQNKQFKNGLIIQVYPLEVITQ